MVYDGCTVCRLKGLHGQQAGCKQRFGKLQLSLLSICRQLHTACGISVQCGCVLHGMPDERSVCLHGLRVGFGDRRERRGIDGLVRHHGTLSITRKKKASAERNTPSWSRSDVFISTGGKSHPYFWKEMKRMAFLYKWKPLARRVVQKKPFGDHVEEETPFVV